jgi:tetrahydromethanopterin S-methyltransferase subunit B
MGRNIDLILERGEKLEDLNEQATRLEEMSMSFKKGAKKLRRVQMWQNAKYGLVVGTAVTGVVAVIVIPPLVALL